MDFSLLEAILLLAALLAPAAAIALFNIVAEPTAARGSRGDVA